jgi:hypothetical protein
MPFPGDRAAESPAGPPDLSHRGTGTRALPTAAQGGPAVHPPPPELQLPEIGQARACRARGMEELGWAGAGKGREELGRGWAGLDGKPAA